MTNHPVRRFLFIAGIVCLVLVACKDNPPAVLKDNTEYVFTVVPTIKKVDLTPVSTSTPTPDQDNSTSSPSTTAPTIEMASTTSSSSHSIPKPPAQKGKPKDTYACSITPEGYCIFSGTPHQTGLEPGTTDIIDHAGNILFSLTETATINAQGDILVAKGTPAFAGDELIQHSVASMSNDEKAFHRVMAILFPIRNALMYDIEPTDQNTWDDLVYELEIRAIKGSTFTNGATPRDNYYGRQGIFHLAKDPKGRDIHHDVMKFLEESGLYLLCHVTSDEFNRMLQETHPEGHDPCKDAKITTKIPFDTTP